MEAKMKPVSVREDGGVVFEFKNLVQHTNVVGVVEPIRVLIPKEKLLQFQKSSADAEAAGRRASQSFARLMKTDDPDEAIPI